MSSPRAFTFVLSAAAERAIERDLPEPVAVAVVDFLYGTLAADPYRVGRPMRSEHFAGVDGMHPDEFSPLTVRAEGHVADAGAPPCRTS